MRSPAGMSARRTSLISSPRALNTSAASSRLTSRRSNGRASLTMRAISTSIFSRSSGVNVRGKRKSYWNFSAWSWRPASMMVPGNSRSTASASTCSAEWRITTPASLSLAVSNRNAPECGSGARRSTMAPSSSPATAAAARRGPIVRATSSGVVPATTLRSLPSGNLSTICSLIVSAPVHRVPGNHRRKRKKPSPRNQGRPCRKSAMVGACGLEPQTSSV